MGEKQGCALSVMLAAVLAFGIASPVSASLPTSPETTPPISAASQLLDAVPPALPSPFAASLEMPSLSPGARICWPRTPTGPRSYFGARYYQAKLARFTTVDPVYTWRDNLVDPQRWNRYAYGRNNPLKYVDPDGKAIWWIAIPLALFYVANNPTPANVTTGPSVEPILPNSVVTLFVLGAYAAYAGLTSAQPDLPSPDKKGGETPFTKAGRLAHKEEPLPEGFEREVRLPSGKRMDGYNADQKKVIEIKPDKPAAVRRGQRQVGGYCQECDQHHGPGHSGAVQTYDPAKYLEKTNKKE
jgi:RHS repeat-associated protein